jgi:transposase-like protein
MSDLQIVEWHPHAKKYPMLAGDEYIAFRESIRRGQKLPVYYRLVKGRVQGLDGRNRLKACQELGIPCRMERVDIPDEQVPDFIDSLNLDRRHLTIEQRKILVKELRDQGQSTRQIADALGVSQSTVIRDIEDTSVSSGEPNGSPELDEPDDSRDETDKTRDEPAQPEQTPTVKGRDGKTYSARRRNGPILCDRCTRVGAIADCPGCAEARKKAGIDSNGKKKKKPRKKKVETVAVLKDMGGKIIPDHLRDAYADMGLRHMVDEFDSISGMFDPTKAVAKAGGYCDHYGFILIKKFEEHIFQAKESLQLAAEALRVGIVDHICPRCDGMDSRRDGTVCQGCRGFGLVPEHQFTELLEMAK